MAAAVERLAWIIQVNAVERIGEAVGIAFAAHFTIGDDVEAGALLVADRKQGRIVLRLVEEFRRHAPQFTRAHARRKVAGQFLPVDQPIRLRVGPHEGCRQEHTISPWSGSFAQPSGPS